MLSKTRSPDILPLQRSKLCSALLDLEPDAPSRGGAGRRRWSSTVGSTSEYGSTMGGPEGFR